MIEAASESFPLDVGVGDDLRPFLSLRRHERLELLWREFLSKYGKKADLEVNDTLVLERRYEIVEPKRTFLYVALIAAALFIVGFVCYYIGSHQSVTAVLVGGGIVLIVALVICAVFLRLGLAALRGSARVEIRSKWSMGKLAKGEFELIRHGANSETLGE